MKNIYIFCILKFWVDLCNITKKTPLFHRPYYTIGCQDLSIGMCKIY